MNVRSTSVGANLGHWKDYAAKNKSPSKGATGEHPPMKLATPVQKKADGGPVKKRGDRFAKGGRTFKDVEEGKKFRFSSEKEFPYSGMATGPWVKTGKRKYRHADEEQQKRYGSDLRVGSHSAGVLDDEPEGEKRGGRAKRARGGRLTGGAETGVGREEKAAKHRRA